MRTEAAESGCAIGPAAGLERREPPELALAGSNDQLSAALDGDPAGFAVGVHLARSAHAQSRLLRSRFVVDAGVDDTAVVSRLMRGDVWLALKYHELQARMLSHQGIGSREAEDAAANDCDVYSPIVDGASILTVARLRHGTMAAT
jgi:hypothetical protein